jgi:4-amino-4-deoxy-L-arabinose transferase-like glycosyltransferase
VTAAPTTPSLVRLPRWLPPAGVALAALGLRLDALDQNGWGAAYYTAAVRSMGESWHNFFYLSFDPAGFASLDKPPFALWLQVASAKLLGFTPFAVMLPQVLCGVAAVLVLYRIVRTRLGEGAALLSAMLFTVTPAWLAVNRTNNVDSCLLLVLLLAAWSMLHAIETGRRRALLGAMALVGLAFQVKMLAAYVVLPVFFGTYAFRAPLAMHRRAQDLVLAGVVVLACSAPWVVAYQLTPVEARPWIGSTPHNSMGELVLGHNGFGRFTARARAEARAPDVTGADSQVPVVARLFVRASPGPLRLAQGLFPVQFAWFLPLALIGAALLVRDRRNVSLLFWTGWAAIYIAVYSVLGGVMHLYYVNTLAPALAVLAAAGLLHLWRSRPLVAAAALVATLAWQVVIHEGALASGQDLDLSRGLQGVAAALVIASAITLAVRKRTHVAAAVAGVAGLLVLPLLWDASLLLRATPGLMPSADLYRLSPSLSEVEQRVYAAYTQMQETSKLQQYLAENRGGARYLMAATTTQVAAPIIIRTGESAVAMGGIHGLDPAMTPERLARLAEAGELRFVLLGDANAISRRMGANVVQRDVAAWVRTNGHRVPAELWRDTGATNARLTLYELPAR